MQVVFRASFTVNFQIILPAYLFQVTGVSDGVDCVDEVEDQEGGAR